MKRCYTLSKSGNRININTFKRSLYPRLYQSESIVPSGVSTPSSPSISKASRLPWFTRLIHRMKRNIFKFSC